MTTAEYAKKYNVTEKTAKKLCREGKITAVKKNNRWEIEDPVAIGENSNSLYVEKMKIDNELKKERLFNLRQDTILKMQKQKFQIEKYRLEFAEGVNECFKDAFSSFSCFLQEAKLQKEDAEKINKVLLLCIEEFEKKLKQYLEKVDAEEDTNVEE